MSMTFEPFTPVRVPEQGGYGGRRRAGEPGETAYGAAPVDPRPAGTPDRIGWTPESWAPPSQQWAAPAPASAPAAVTPPPAVPDSRGGRSRRVVIALVALLVVVAGWQAYRLESMSGHNQELAARLAAEQGRTDRMEKQLAGYFDPETIAAGVLPSVFRVRAGDLTGTAFSVAKKASGSTPAGSNLFTNYHVVAEVWTDGGRTVTLERGSTKISATIVKVNKGKDLALLHTTKKIAGLAPAGAEVKPGQPVVVVGAPLGLDDSVTTGGISALWSDDQDGPMIQFDAPINPGNSGGPVVNAGKQVVGLATAKVKDSEGIGLAIPITTACDAFGVC